MSELSASHERLITALARRKVRAQEGLFLAEGVRVVEELLAAGVGIRVAVVAPTLEETERGRAIAATLHQRGDVARVGPARMDRLSETRTSQGVLVVAEAPGATLDAIPVPPRTTVLVLDGVQDPGNLGTLARSAAGFGCGALLCLTGTVDPWNPKAVRASAGALFRLPVVTAGVDESLAWLERGGFELLGADAAGEPIDRVAFPERVALAVGNEGAGLGESVRAGCDRIVAVPMREGTESLNVAVAAGILLYVMTRGRA
ncbi:MAG TPA: RNA methyltransferase [Longimicrobiales bacterium]|nr:RNA methyltransferase [Longimicrobiales bacterium]